MPNLVVRILLSLGLALLCGCQLVDNTIRGRLLPRDPLSIFTITDQTIPEGGVTGDLAFTVTGLVGPSAHAPCSSVVNTSTSAPDIIPLSGAVISGTVPYCRVAVSAPSPVTGTAMITLVATSNNRTASSTFQVIVLSSAPPPDVTNLIITAVSPTEIALSWTSSGGSTADYRISYQTGAAAPADCAAGTTISETAISGTAHTVAGLMPDTLYSFRICTINANSTPDESTGVTGSATTPEAPPPEVTSVIATVVSPTQINLYWTSSGGSTADYRISYQAGATAPNNCTSGTTVSETAIAGPAHAVTGLAAGTQYSFRICAINANPTPDVSVGVVAQSTTSTPILTSVKTMAKGDKFSCAIRNDDTLWCWGADATITNSVDGLAIPFEIALGTTWKTLGAGLEHVCAIRNDDTLWCWGNNSHGQLGNGSTAFSQVPIVVASGTTWKSVSAGGYHTCAIKSDNTLWCWGLGSDGQRGDNNSALADQPTPVEVHNGGNWAMVDAGNVHTCAVKDNSSLWCWGNNLDGRLGDNTLISRQAPVQVFGAGSWGLISAGLQHTCAIKSDDRVYCFGRNYSGELGDGTTSDRRVPTAISSVATWIAVHAAANLSCGIQTNGSLWCWGTNSWGTLGASDNKEETDNYSPRPVAGGQTWLQVVENSSDQYRSGMCAIDVTNKVFCWGPNEGQGGSRASTSNLPAPVMTGSTWKKIGQTSTENFCAIQTDDSLWCWGTNSYGEVGDGTTTNRDLPTLISAGSTWKDVSIGHNHTCGITNDGSLWCWGLNRDGQLGIGSYANSALPSQVAAGQTWQQVTAFAFGTCALKIDNSIWCWGSDGVGSLGNGAGGSSNVPVVVAGGGIWKQLTSGYRHVCGLKSDDSAWCWGLNTLGTIGDGTTNNRQSPQAILEAGPWKSIIAGGSNTCATKQLDNSLWCWGGGGDGQLGTGTYTDALIPQLVGGGSPWNQVSTGSYRHSCGIRSDSSVWCWGTNEFNQFGDGLNSTLRTALPTTVFDFTPWLQVEAARFATCGLKQEGSLWCWGLQKANPYSPILNNW